jgi:hypothetical protein
LTARSNELAFRAALGPPLHESKGIPPDPRHSRCVWKLNGMLIDAEFLDQDWTDNGKPLRKGMLAWFYVSPAL